MRKSGVIKIAGAVFMLVVLAGCGGGASSPSFTGTGSGSGSGSGSGGSTVTASSTPANIIVTSDVQSINSTTGTATITAIVTDANNLTVKNAAVKFSANGGALTIANADASGNVLTDASGKATATLAKGGAPSGSTIVVSASVSPVAGAATTSVSVTATPVYKLGVLSGASFTANTIKIAISPATLAAGGSSGLTVNLVDTANNNQPYSGTATVAFTSPCISNNQSSANASVTSNTGTFNNTYQAQGCNPTDVITATTTVNGTTLTAQGTINVAPAPASSIQFISATPKTMGLQGSGQVTTSTVVFKVLNNAGGPASGLTVNFSLDSNAGGLALANASGTTGADGLVQTTVKAGTVHTSVRVTATIPSDPTVPPAQSSSLTVSTGLADQNSFSMSVGCFNIEGGDYDGVTTPVNILAADRFNNPVPDGTAVAFTTEGGSIGSQCLTANGACTVNFVSQSPRLIDHRATILATAIGEESFIDTNGNGQFDDGESFTDLPEAFRDDNENGAFDIATEVPLDFNNNGTYDAATGKFKGVLCKGPTKCDAATSLNVRASSIVIMSGSTATIGINPNPINLSSGSVSVAVTVGDSANQPMPGGTIIKAETSYGSIVGTASYTQVCTAVSSPFVYTFNVAPPAGAPTSGSGILTITVTTPKGTATIASVPVSNTAPPAAPPPAGNLSSMQFVAASPTLIGIRGSGTPETSTVSFKALSDTGAVVANRDVAFSLSTNTGGISLSPLCATTDASGTVQTIVRSGTVHTAVRVKAIAQTTSNGSCGGAASGNIEATSSQLVISTGIPDQDSFSISATQLNIEGNNRDGVTTTITARLADRYNNPAQDGTAVAFTTEGGAVVANCTTSGGACSVTFTSQNPRGAANHRYTVLATAVGEESFTDLNGNGQYDDGEPFTDLPEAFRDDNENGSFDPASEVPMDFNGNGVYDAATGKFKGVLCKGPTNCDASTSVNVRGSTVIVMSSSVATISNPGDITIPVGTGTTVTITVQDTAGQAMAKGTTIAATTSYGSVATPTSYTQADTTAPGGTQTYTFAIQAGATTGNGILTFTVTSPSGVQTTRTVSFTGI